MASARPDGCAARVAGSQADLGGFDALQLDQTWYPHKPGRSKGGVCCRRLAGINGRQSTPYRKSYFIIENVALRNTELDLFM